MSNRPAPRLAVLLTAFCLTLSLLALRDRLDSPHRVAVEPTPIPVVVLAGG